METERYSSVVEVEIPGSLLSGGIAAAVRAVGATPPDPENFSAELTQIREVERQAEDRAGGIRIK